MSDSRATFEAIEGMIEKKVIRTVHVGKSATGDDVRFATLDLWGGGTFTGKGATVAEAFEAALDSRIGRDVLDDEAESLL